VKNYILLFTTIITFVSTTPNFAQSAHPRNSIVDVIAFGGMVIPQGELKQHARSAPMFGGGLGKNLWQGQKATLRASLTTTNEAKLQARQQDRTGELNLHLVTLRSDLVCEHGSYRPFIGTGASQARWRGTISQPSTALQNTGRHIDYGGVVVLGVDKRFSNTLLLTPEISYMKFGGKFGEPLVTLSLNVRWEI
jgi:hypothetical protein